MKLQAILSLQAIGLLSLINIVFSEPVQYCKYGSQNSEINFCMGVLMHHNISTSSHDLYLTMSITRHGSTSLGWTAIGLGEIMEGALMFIIYGDPMSSEQPIVSIRKATGHRQPTLVTRADINGADLRVVRADWLPAKAGIASSNSAVAMISLVFYSCHFWPGTHISAESKSQPWMWAWNSNQEIPVFSYDAHLKMHKHHAGAGGWGNFYVDMARSVNNWKNAPSFPPIRPGVLALGASESPGISAANGLSWLKHNSVLHLHGIIVGMAFLLLFPVGVFVMRSGSPKSFKHHWVIQLVASLFTIIGVMLGLSLGQKIDTVHQIVGILLATFLGIQAVLGWRHHMVFLNIHRRTWLSHSHIWLGRLMMIVGWANLITGMMLHGYSGLCIAATGLLVGSEAFGLTSWLWWIKGKARTLRAKPEYSQEWGREERQADSRDYFALGDDEYDDDTNSEDVKNEEAKPMVDKAAIK